MGRPVDFEWLANQITYGSLEFGANIVNMAEDEESMEASMGVTGIESDERSDEPASEKMHVDQPCEKERRPPSSSSGPARKGYELPW